MGRGEGTWRRRDWWLRTDWLPRWGGTWWSPRYEAFLRWLLLVGGGFYLIDGIGSLAGDRWGWAAYQLGMGAAFVLGSRRYPAWITRRVNQERPEP